MFQRAALYLLLLVVALVVGVKVRDALDMLEGWSESHTDWLIELEHRTQKLEGVRS